MNFKKTLGELIVGAIFTAIVFTICRPGSPAAQAVADTTNALAAMVKTSTNYTSQ
jgi:hypothetical protein